jgi:hypothetical protein
MAQTISSEILQAALAGLRLQERHIQEQIAEVESMLDGKSVASTATVDGSIGKRRKFSAASRRKMAAAQKARWAKLKGESEPDMASSKPVPPKRKMSASARKAIGEATRKRWAAKRASEAAQARKAAPKKIARKSASKVSAKKSIKKAAGKKAVGKKTAPAAPALVAAAV